MSIRAKKRTEEGKARDREDGKLRDHLTKGGRRYPKISRFLREDVNEMKKECTDREIR